MSKELSSQEMFEILTRQKGPAAAIPTGLDQTYYSTVLSSRPIFLYILYVHGRPARHGMHGNKKQIVNLWVLLSIATSQVHSLNLLIGEKRRR